MNNKNIMTLITGLCLDLEEIPGMDINFFYASEKRYIRLTVCFKSDSYKYGYAKIFQKYIYLYGSDSYSPKELLNRANELKELIRVYGEK